MNILQLSEVDKNRRIVLHKDTLEAIDAGIGEEFIVYENDGRLVLAKAKELEEGGSL